MSLSEQVVEWLKEEIVYGRLRPGQWVSENVLASSLGMSRSPVREALRVLAKEGLVRVIPRRGTIIAELDGRDAQDLYDARRLVEGEVVRLAAERITPADINALAVVLEQMRDAVDDATRYFGLNVGFHERLLELCPNGVLRDMTQLLWLRSLRFRNILLRLPGQIEKSLAAHERLLTLLGDGDSDGAKQLMQDLIDDAQRTLLEEFFVNIGGEVRTRPLAIGGSQW